MENIEKKLNKLREIIDTSVKKKSYVWGKRLDGNWDKLWSSFDAIEESHKAITKFYKSPKCDGLEVYGVLQALIIQQDAVKHLKDSLGLGIFNWGDYKELNDIREARVGIAGHPSEIKKIRNGRSFRNGEISFSSSLSIDGKMIEYVVWSNDGAVKKKIDLEKAIENQKKILDEILESTIQEIGLIEVKHTKKFKKEKLANLFCCYGYNLTKIYSFERERSLSAINLSEIERSYTNFLDGIRERYDFEPNESNIHLPGFADEIKKTDYIIDKVKRNISLPRGSDLIDFDIYVDSLKQQMELFEIYAKEIDEKFNFEKE